MESLKRLRCSYVAACCSVLLRVAVCCSVVCCSVLQCAAVRCRHLYCSDVAACCSVLRRAAVQHDVYKCIFWEISTSDYLWLENLDFTFPGVFRHMLMFDSWFSKFLLCNKTFPTVDSTQVANFQGAKLKIELACLSQVYFWFAISTYSLKDLWCFLDISVMAYISLSAKSPLHALISSRLLACFDIKNDRVVDQPCPNSMQEPKQFDQLDLQFWACVPIVLCFINMMMIVFNTIKSSLVPLIEGLCAQIYFRFEISVVCSHLLLSFFVKGKTC